MLAYTKLKCARRGCVNLITGPRRPRHCSKECKFLSAVAKIRKRPGKCWPWSGNKAWGGYGKFIYLDGPATTAHRASWEVYNKKKAPKGMVICHRCDNPPCVNPDHLFLGTHKDNAMDMVAKQRHPQKWTGARRSFQYLTNEKWEKQTGLRLRRK